MVAKIVISDVLYEIVEGTSAEVKKYARRCWGRFPIKIEIPTEEEISHTKSFIGQIPPASVDVIISRKRYLPVKA